MSKVKLYRWLMHCLLVGWALACLPNAYAQTTSGVLTADETWSGDVYVTGDVTVPPGSSLAGRRR